jgi:hypothetical protein
MKLALFWGVALFIAGVLVALVQLWASPWSPELFVKIEFTLGALLAVLVAVWFTRKEYQDYKRQETDSSLDD